MRGRADALTVDRPGLRRPTSTAAARPGFASPAQVVALQRSAGNAAVGRVLSERGGDISAGGAVVPEVSDGIAATRSAGSRLDARLATRAGRAIGADLSNVRVHTDGDADLLSRSVGARAFTTGSDVYFRSGQYRPDTAAGRHLLAHELTHVRQQAGTGDPAPQGKLEVAPAHSPGEDEADAVADAVADRLGSDVAGPSVAGAGTMSVANGVQRSIGFEFQTGWGLVRSLPAAPLNPVTDRSEDPRPMHQGDWEDEAVDHTMVPGHNAVSAPTRSLPPKRSWKDRLLGRNKAPVIGPSPMMPALNDMPHVDVNNDQWVDPTTQTQYMDKKANVIAGPTANRVHYKFHKGQIIKDYGAFKMTVDDATTALGAELEWVVDPPIPDSASVRDVGRVMTDLHNVVKMLLAFQNRESFLLSEVTKQQADDVVELQPGVKGGRNMQAAAQATGGVSIDKLITLFSDLGTTGAQSGLQAPKAEVSGGSYAKSAATAGASVEGSARLQGLVAFIQRYLAMGAGDGALSYAKVNTQFLARTDFATMFRLLPDEELGKYGGDAYMDQGGSSANPDDFVLLVTTACKVAEDRKIFKGGVRSGGGTKDIPLTVGDWLRGIADGVDLLSGKYWKGIANDDDTPDLEKQEAQGMSKELESMGNLGSKRDSVGANRDDLGIIMEFRSNTQPQKPEKWKLYATTIFRYLKELNRL